MHTLFYAVVEFDKELSTTATGFAQVMFGNLDSHTLTVTVKLLSHSIRPHALFNSAQIHHLTL